MPPGGQQARITWSSNLIIRPEPEYLIDELLPRSGFGTIYGKPKTKKTFYVLDLCYHVATGEPYRGHGVFQGPVIYVPYEGEEGLMKRWTAVRQHYGWHRDIPFGVLQYEGSAPPLSGNVSRQMVRNIVEATGEKPPVLVVLDTVGRSLKGSYVKDDDVSNYIRSARILKESFGCLVLVIHHRSKSNIVEPSPLGSVMLMAANDVQILVEAGREGNTFGTTVEYIKDGPSHPQMWHDLKIVTVGKDSRGRDITTGVVVPLEIGRVASNKLSKALGEQQQFNGRDRLARKALRALARLGPSENGTEVKVAEWREVCFRAGVVWDKLPVPDSMAKGFNRALERLHADNLITVENGTVSIVGAVPDNVVELGDFREK
jgi:AAA domain